MPDLDTALLHYPAEVVRLEGGVKSSIQGFLERNAIDILVVGEHWPSTGLQLTSGARGRGRACRGCRCPAASIGYPLLATSRAASSASALASSSSLVDSLAATATLPSGSPRPLALPQQRCTSPRQRCITRCHPCDACSERVGEGQRELPLPDHPPLRGGQARHEDIVGGRRRHEPHGGQHLAAARHPAGVRCPPATPAPPGRPASQPLLRWTEEAALISRPSCPSGCAGAYRPRAPPSQHT